MPDFYARSSGSFSLLNDRTSWRQPQRGALGALLAHWSLGEPDATLLSIPTGTGKTAVAMAAPFLAPSPPSRVLVLAPSQAVRKQLHEEFSSQALLQRIGCLPEEIELPSVFEMAGRVDDWGTLTAHDVVIALPNSISPLHYEDDAKPPSDLFDLVIIDEAHHAPSKTWEAVLDYFAASHQLLLTATPVRRDGKRIPGKPRYYYPLRRAIDQGFYKSVVPVLLEPPIPENRAASDKTIAEKAAAMLASEEHATSVLLVRAGSIERLRALRDTYAEAGVDLTLLYNTMGKTSREEVIDGLRDGGIRVVGVVGMLGEGFDLPSIRLVAYHDKHRSVPATVQLIGRLARVDPVFPQPSSLITVADAEVFPELKGVLRELYEEDADWATVLPGILDEDIAGEQSDREFVERFPPSQSEIDAVHLQPTKRAFLYEVPEDWEPPFLGPGLLPELALGERFQGGEIAYAGSDLEAGMLVIVVRYAARPRWSSDPALEDVSYQLHIVAHRRPTEVDQPGLVFLNLATDGQLGDFEQILGLKGVGEPVSPEKLGEYLDSLDRISVSSVGVRSTSAASRGRASYRTFMGGEVDRGMRSVDMAQSAMGHVGLQVNTENGSANAGGAVEKSKVWLSRYEPLRQFSEWVDTTAKHLWYPQQSKQGPLLPGMDRGRRLNHWPDARPLAAEISPRLFGGSYQLWRGEIHLGAIEDLALYVNDDPTKTLTNIEGADGGSLGIVGVFENRAAGTEECVWRAALEVDGGVVVDGQDLSVLHGYAGATTLAALLEEHPPTVYFLDRTTTIGAVRYDPRGATVLNSLLVTAVDWNGTDITAETVATAEKRGHGQRSIHEQLEQILRDRPKAGQRRWLLKNDGSGEIADYVVIEELQNGEVQLGLWHAKASSGANPSVRIKDCQVVAAQALRSRRWLRSTELWSELASRLSGQASPPATLVEGSDDGDELKLKLGLGPEDEEQTPWTESRPVVHGLIAVVQPGLTKGGFTTQLAESPVPSSAEAVRELFVILSDTATEDGSTLQVIGSA